MIALDDMSPENGCPELAAETWKRKEGWLFGPDFAYPPEDGLGPWASVELRRGEVLVYDNYMLHRSGANATDTDRRALFAIFNAARDGDFHSRYYEREANGRRKAGTKGLAGKANTFFTGTGVVVEAGGKL
jgi:ectoine hydroxylase-related dioxygenase (phytanoyl-CoA dioxygenase family)